MKKLKKISSIAGVTALLLQALVGTVKAQQYNTINLMPGGQWSVLASFSPSSLVQAMISFAMVIAGLVAFGFLIYGGILWITSGGDKTKTESARNTITAALIGLVIVFASWAIMKIMEMLFGVCILVLNFSGAPVTNGS